jgi:hypothetical protein
MEIDLNLCSKRLRIEYLQFNCNFSSTQCSINYIKLVLLLILYCLIFCVMVIFLVVKTEYEINMANCREE